MDTPQDLMRTALYQTHVEMGGRMVPFSGWEMPVQYAGILAEARAVRSAAGLFDVSHMGQVFLRGESYEAVALALEALAPVDVACLLYPTDRADE